MLHFCWAILLTIITFNVLVILLPPLKLAIKIIPITPKVVVYDGVSDAHTLINRTDFEYTISQWKCKEASNSFPLVVTLVQSKPQNIVQRNAIRTTWFNSDARMLSYFVLASAESEELQKEIKKENEQFNDIIQGNFIDSVENRIYKHAMTFKWFSNNCGEADYLIKIDDDVFMNVPAVIEYLRSKETNKSDINGYRDRAQLQIKADEEIISPDYHKYLVFPEYAMGFAVIYSNYFVNAAYPKLKPSRLALHDDIYVTAIIGLALNMKITALNDRFFYNPSGSFVLNSSNSNFLFTFGGIYPDAMFSLWRQTHHIILSNELELLK